MWIAASLTLLSLGALAMATRQPLIFPPLGPTALLMFATPRLPTAAPRNAFVGHLVGMTVGWASLWAFGLLGEPSALLAGFTLPRVGAAAFSLGLTGAITSRWAPHPPAGATTLIISLGVLARPTQLAALMAAVVLLIGLASGLNRLAEKIGRPGFGREA